MPVAGNKAVWMRSLHVTWGFSRLSHVNIPQLMVQSLKSIPC